MERSKTEAVQRRAAVIATDSVDIDEECRLTFAGGSQELKNGVDIDDAPCCIAAGLSPAINPKNILSYNSKSKILALPLHKIVQ